MFFFSFVSWKKGKLILKKCLINYILQWNMSAVLLQDIKKMQKDAALQNLLSSSPGLQINCTGRWCDHICVVCLFNCWVQIPPLLTGLFYYAGHGYEHAGRNYLVAVDAPQPYRPENCVCVQRVMRSMQKKHTALSVILLDTCRKWLVEKIVKLSIAVLYPLSISDVFVKAHKWSVFMMIALLSSVFCRYNQDCTPSSLMPLGPSGNTVYGYATYVLFQSLK